jgi:hypothetical protein
MAVSLRVSHNVGNFMAGLGTVGFCKDYVSCSSFVSYKLDHSVAAVNANERYLHVDYCHHLNLAGKCYTLCIFREAVISSIPLCRYDSVGGLCLESMTGNGNCGIFLFEIYTDFVVVVSITRSSVTFWCCHSSGNFFIFKIESG